MSDTSPRLPVEASKFGLLKYARWVVPVLLMAPATPLQAETTTSTRVIHATYRIGGGKSNATCWMVSHSQPAAGPHRLLLVTAAHVLEQVDGDEAILVGRSTIDGNQFERAKKTLAIRKDGQPLWTKHPGQDVAVLTLDADLDVRSIPVEALATAADWTERPVEAGALVRCVGFPHAAHFDPSPAAFPLVRLGCLASYPLQPVHRHPTFLVDFNTFEGDSGGPVLLPAGGDKSVKVIGLVSAQHFIDEKYDLIYAKGQIRKRLGLSIVVQSQLILDTIELASSAAKQP